MQKYFVVVCWCGLIAAPASFPQDRPSQVRIGYSNDECVMVRDGKPFFIKGAGGAQEHMGSVVAAGGNSIREWSPDETVLNQARQAGLTALVGLPLEASRQGFDYGNAELVQKQLDQVIQTIRQLKGNPAVLMWALGNELELNASPEERIAAWKAVEQAARAVKKEDPYHPVMAVLAGAGQDKLRELDQYCPSLDAVGINTYGGIISLPETIKAQGFKRPYIVTEFGARGHWEVGKTAWGMPIEDTSTQKEQFIVKGYEHSIADQKQCLGSYVFLWGQKQEKTHTWYGLFLPDGTRLGGVDAMQYLWTGKWPAHRSPIIQQAIEAKPDGTAGESAPDVFRAGSKISCKILASDPHGDPLSVTWELRRDVANNPSSGGDREPPAPPISDAVVHQSDRAALIKIPGTPGDYRIFVYVYNRSGGAATANLPLEAK